MLYRNSIHHHAWTALVSTHDTSESEDSKEVLWLQVSGENLTSLLCSVSWKSCFSPQAAGKRYLNSYDHRAGQERKAISASSQLLHKFNS